MQCGPDSKILRTPRIVDDSVMTHDNIPYMTPTLEVYVPRDTYASVTSPVPDEIVISSEEEKEEIVDDECSDDKCSDDSDKEK